MKNLVNQPVDREAWFMTPQTVCRRDYANFSRLTPTILQMEMRLSSQLQFSSSHSISHQRDLRKATKAS
jgi:hypothetical protein